jgi:hypothetical protein
VGQFENIFLWVFGGLTALWGLAMFIIAFRSVVTNLEVIKEELQRIRKTLRRIEERDWRI